jgi:1,4-alpha-glucan branching enzyme
MDEKINSSILKESRKEEIQKSSEQPVSSKRYEDLHFVDSTRAVWNYSRFTEEDIHNFQRGTHYKLNELFGSHHVEVLGRKGYYFAVWAPNATFVSVIGNFNDWNKESHPLFVRLERSGIWEGFIPDLPKGEAYKYHIHGFKGRKLDKGDPYGNFWEVRPQTATITWDLKYQWGDTDWMKKR